MGFFPWPTKADCSSEFLARPKAGPSSTAIGSPVLECDKLPAVLVGAIRLGWWCVPEEPGPSLASRSAPKVRPGSLAHRNWASGTQSSVSPRTENLPRGILRSDSDSKSTLPSGVRPKPHSEILGGAPVARGEAMPRAGSAPLRVKVILALRDAPQAPLSVHLDSCAPPPRSRTLRAA